MKNSNDLRMIVSKFCYNGSITSIDPFGSGHINDTYHVKNKNALFPDYLLQRINQNVFKNIPGLMRNFRIVTDHIKQKLTSAGIADYNERCLTLVHTKENKDYVKDEIGDYWRLCVYISGTRSYDRVTNQKQAYQGGRAFGGFQNLVSEIDPETLVETIPDFHNVVSRLEKLEHAIAADSCERLKNIQKEINFIIKRVKSMSAIAHMGMKGELPLRITHNDTKFNNILLNELDEAQCVIDLDTVMPGYVAFDFGDAVRTIVNNSAEDETDTSKIEVNLYQFSY